MKPFAHRSNARRWLFAVLVVLSTAPRLHAQRAPDDACTRLTFGPWTPPLNWNRAGHPDSASGVGSRVRHLRDSLFGGQASVSRRDEMQWEESGGMRRLFLSPAWWPAGVMITFARAGSAGSDTLIGEAMALVADGKQVPPRTEARLLRSGCHARSP